MPLALLRTSGISHQMGTKNRDQEALYSVKSFGSFIVKSICLQHSLKVKTTTRKVWGVGRTHQTQPVRLDTGVVTLACGFLPTHLITTDLRMHTWHLPH